MKNKKIALILSGVLLTSSLVFPFVITSCSSTSPSKDDPGNSGINISTSPISEINKNIISNVTINNLSYQITDDYFDIIDILFQTNQSYNISIDLVNNYNKLVFGDLGFSNPTIKYELLSSTDYFEINNNVISTKKSIDSSIFPQTFELNINVIISQEGYISQNKNFRIHIENENNNQIGDEPMSGIDYTVEPGKDPNDQKNWITNPFSKNKKMTDQWGTISLPMKDEITKDDLFDLFYRAVVNDYMFDMNFGKRNISLKFFIDTYIEWLVKNWQYFPWLAFQNWPINFKTDMILSWEDIYNHRDNLEEYFTKTDWKITSTKLFNQAEKITWDSKERDDFINGLMIFFSNYIRPGMSDLDKFFAVFQFVSIWINYGGSKFYEYSVWSNHEGVCVHYAWVTAQLLTMLGIPAIPMSAAKLEYYGEAPDYPLDKIDGHAVTWVYIDPDGGQNKKWYLVDVTWGDINQKGVTAPNISVPAISSSRWSGFLEPINSEKWGRNFNYLPQQNNYFQFWLGPWNSIFENDSAMISKDESYKSNWGTFQNITSGFGGSTGTSMSRPVFNNGKWYVLVKFKNKNDVVLYETSMNSTNINKVDIPPQFYKHLVPNKYSDPGMAQFRNWVIMLDNNSVAQELGPNDYTKSRTLVFHNLDDPTWKDSFTWTLPNDLLFTDEEGEWKANRANINTLYVNNDRLIVEYETLTISKRINTTVEYPLSKIENDTGKKILNIQNDSYLTSGDVELAKIFFKYIGNTHKIGVNNYETTYEEKVAYNNYFKNFNSSKEYYNDIKRINDYYLGFEKSLIKNNEFLEASVPNDLYTISLNDFKEFGYDLDINSGYDSFKKLSYEEYDASIKYDIYFSNSKDGKFKCIASDLNDLFLKYEMFSKNELDPNGYIYYLEKKDNGNTLKSKIFEFRTNYNVLPNISTSFSAAWDNDSIYIKSNSITNYIRKEPYWSRKKWGVYIDLYLPDSIDYKFELILKSFKFKTKTIETIQTWKDIGKIKEAVPIGLITNDNKGIYFLDLKITLKKDPSISYSSYSKLIYLLSSDDIEKNNFNDWINLSMKLKDILKK